MALLLMMGFVFGGSVLADSATPTAVASDNATATLTIHKDSATGTVVDSTTKLDRNATYYAELAISYKNGGTQPSASNDVWEYDFPDGITLNATSGSIYDAANAVMGSYSISGSKLTINFDDTWLSTHTSDIETHFTISFKFDSSKTSDQSSVTYNFPAVTDPITVTFDDGNVTGTKSVNSKNGAAVVNDDGSVDYTITLNQDTTVTNFKLIDTLGDNMEYIQDSFQMDGQAITPTFDGQTATIEKATLENSSGHTITYKAKLKSTVAPINGWYDKTTNTAKWTWGTDGTGSAQAWAGLYSTMISKTVNGNKTAKTSAWTVTLNSGNVKVDMGGYVFKDTLTSNNQKYTGTATIKDSDGNVIRSVTLNSGDKNFTYTFPDNAGKKQYTITYTTSVDEPGQYGSQTYSNEGTITTKDGSSNWKADKDWTWKGSGIGNADIITKEITNNDSANSGDVSWKVVIKGSAVTDGINNVIFQDDFNDSNEKDHVWFDKTEGIVIKDGDKVLVEGTDYTIAYKDTGSDGKYEQFNVTFKGDYATLTTDLTVTYTSHSDKTPGKYNNWAQISYYVNGAKYNNHATLDYTIANTNYVQKTGWASYDSSKSTNIANWTVYGNVKNQSEKTGVIKCNGEDVTLTDVLPSGMTYVEGSAKYQMNLNGTEMALTPAVSTVDGKTTLTFTIPKVNQDAIKVTYQTQVAPSDLTQNGDNTFTNNATMTSGSTVIGSGSATVWVHNNALSKTSEKADNMVKYTITANGDAQDLVPDSDELKLEDVLDYQTELVASSVSVKDGSGKSLSSDQYKVSIADTTDANGKATSKLTITVPDGQKLVISYLVTLKGTLGQTINIDNKVNLSGRSTVKTDNNSWYQILQSSAGGSGATGSIIVTKADKDNVTTTLKGATFDLYRVQNDSNLSEATIAAHSTKVDTETTGDAGTVTFQKDGSTTLLKDQLYYFVETAAPSGYQLDTTLHYFMLGGVDAVQTLADLTAKLPNINIGNGTSYTVYDEKAATSLSLGATKTVDGQTPTDAQVFDFSLTQTSTTDGAVNNTIQTVQNNHGTITFSPLTFSKAGTYTYTVQETGNHTGNTGNYVKDATVYTVTVDVSTQADGSLKATEAYTKADGQPADTMAFNNQTDKKTVEISKTDIATGHELAGAVLTIKDASGNTVDSWTSAADKTHSVQLAAGTYTLTETTAPTGYTKAESITFTVDASGAVTSTTEGAVSGNKITMKDASETTSITATKKWDDGNNAAKLRPAKVTFQLEQTVNNVTRDVANQRQTVDVTGETQTVTFNNLPKSVDGQAITYSVKETGTDPNYAASVSPDGLTITNTLGKHDVQISKVSTGNGQELADAVLTVTNKTTGDKVASWTSDGSTKTISVPAGSYTLTETTAPDGFKKAEAIDFTVGSDGTVTSDALAGGKIVMKDAPTTVTIDKQALSNSAELAGAVLKVTDKNGQTIKLDGKKLTWTSNGTDKWTITGLKSGDYKLVEETAPNGYAVAESIDFSIDANGNVTSKAMDANGVIIMKDASLSLKVSKITTTGTTELSGAALKIIDVTTTTGDVIKDAANSDLSWTSGSAPQTIDTSNFVIGHVYALVETAAPSGYYTAEQINFRFNEAGQIQVYNKLSREYETIDGDTIVMKDAPIPVTPAPSTTTPTATTPTATPSTTASQPTTVNPTTPYATPSTTTPSTTTATPSTTTVTPNSGTTTSTTAPSTTTGSGTATSVGSGAGTSTGTVSNSTASGNVNTGVHQDSLPIAMAALSALGAIVILAAYKRRKEN